MYKYVLAIVLGVTVSQIDAMTLSKYREFQEGKEFKQHFEKSTDLIRGFVVLQSGILKYHRLFGNIDFFYNGPECTRTGSLSDKGNDAMSKLLILMFPSVGVEDLNISGTNSLSNNFPNQEELIKITAELLKISDQARKDENFNPIDEKKLKSIEQNNKGNIKEIARVIKERIFSLAYENSIKQFDEKIKTRISTHESTVENLKQAITELSEGIESVENLTVEPLEIGANCSLPIDDIKQAIKTKANEISTEIVENFSKELTEDYIQSCFKISPLEVSQLTNIIERLIEEVNILDCVKEYWNMTLRQDISSLLQAINDLKTNEKSIEQKRRIDKIFKGMRTALQKKSKQIQYIEQKQVDSKLNSELTIAGTRYAKLANLIKTTVDATRLENKKYPLGYATNIICAYAWNLITPENLPILARHIGKNSSEEYISHLTQLIYEKDNKGSMLIPFYPGTTPCQNGKTYFREHMFNDCVDTMVRHFFSLLFSTVKDEHGQKDEEGIHLEFNRIPNDSQLRRFFSPDSDICSLVAGNSTNIRNIWADIICGHNNSEELEARNNSPIYYVQGKNEDKWIDGGWELDSGWKNVIRIICWLLRDYKADEDKELENYSDKETAGKLQKKKEEAQSFIEDVNQNRFSLENSTDITKALDILLGIRSDIEFKVNGFYDVSSQNNHNDQSELYGKVQLCPKDRNRQKNDMLNFVVTQGHAYVDKIEDSERKQVAQQQILEQDSNEPSGFDYVEKLYIDKKYLRDEDTEKYPWIKFWGNINYCDNVGDQRTEETASSIINLLEMEEGSRHIGGIIRFIQNDSSEKYRRLFSKIEDKLCSSNSEFFIRNSISFFNKLKHNKTANSFISSAWCNILARKDGYKYIRDIFRTNDEFLEYFKNKKYGYFSLPDSFISNTLYFIKNNKESPVEFIKLINELSGINNGGFSKELHEIVNDKLLQALHPKCEKTSEILKAILKVYDTKKSVSYDENIINKITSYLRSVPATKKLNSEQTEVVEDLCQIIRTMVENSQFDEASFEIMLKNTLQIFTKVLDLNYKYDYYPMFFIPDTLINLLGKGDIRELAPKFCSLLQKMQKCRIELNIANYIQKNSSDIFIKNALLLSSMLKNLTPNTIFNIFYRREDIDKYTNDIKNIMLSDSQKADSVLDRIEKYFREESNDSDIDFVKKTFSFVTNLSEENISPYGKAKIAIILMHIKPILSRTEASYDFSKIGGFIKETLNQLLDHPSDDLTTLIQMAYDNYYSKEQNLTSENLPFDKTKLKKLPAYIDYILQNSKEEVVTVGQLLDLIKFDQVDQTTRETIKRFTDNTEKAFTMSLPVERSKEKTELLLQLSSMVDSRNADDIFQKYPELCQSTSNALLIFENIEEKLSRKLLDGIKKEDLTPEFIRDLFNTNMINLMDGFDFEFEGFEEEEEKKENGEVINDSHSLAKWVLNNYPKLSEVKDIIEEHLSEQEKEELEKRIKAEETLSAGL